MEQLKTVSFEMVEELKDIVSSEFSALAEGFQSEMQTYLNIIKAIDILTTRKRIPYKKHMLEATDMAALEFMRQKCNSCKHFECSKCGIDKINRKLAMENEEVET